MNLSKVATQQIDSSNMSGDILALRQHLLQALDLTEAAQLPRWSNLDAMIVAGMGGSSAGGMLASAILHGRTIKPVVFSRGYQIPSWVSTNTAVLCLSYSGNTEETLAAYQAAREAGARIIVASSGGTLVQIAREDQVPVILLPGGLQPRCAVGYMTVAALQAMSFAGIAPAVEQEVRQAAQNLEALNGEWSGGDSSLVKELASKLGDTTPIITGAGPSAAVAYRWKTQINENAESPAWCAVLPEADHNEIVGWTRSEQVGKFSVVILDDQDIHPRERQRLSISGEIIQAAGIPVYWVESQGSSPAERIMSLVAMGDWVSYYMAIFAGVDPTPVTAINRLKEALQEDQ